MVFAHDFPHADSVTTFAHSGIQYAGGPHVRIPMVALRIAAGLNLVGGRTFETVLGGGFDDLARPSAKTYGGIGEVLSLEVNK